MKYFGFILCCFYVGFGSAQDSITAYFDQPTTFEEVGMFGKKRIFKIEKRDCNSVTASSTLEEGSSKYLAQNLLDGSSKTAWVEGTDSLGIGETLFFEFRKLRDFYVGCPDIIEIVPGYGKNAKTWKENARLLSFNLVLLNVDKEEDYPVESFHVQLQTEDGDLPMRSQFIDISPYHIQNMAVDFFKYMRFEIVDVIAGSKYNDLCISQINFYNKLPVN